MKINWNITLYGLVGLISCYLLIDELFLGILLQPHAGAVGAYLYCMAITSIMRERTRLKEEI